MKKIKIFEKRVIENYIGRWNEYCLFGQKVRAKLVGIFKYE